jgi:uncharacterized MAPEG superfamily protein
MNAFADNPGLKIYALCAAIVAIHLFVLAGITGGVRATRKVFVNPEDAKLNKAEQADNDHPDVLRVKRAHQNLMESAIPFFAIGLLYAFTGPKASSAQAYYFTFVGARVLHTIFYMMGLQPFRTITFVIGFLTVLGMSVQVIMHAM